MLTRVDFAHNQRNELACMIPNPFQEMSCHVALSGVCCEDLSRRSEGSACGHVEKVNSKKKSWKKNGGTNIIAIIFYPFPPPCTPLNWPPILKCKQKMVVNRDPHGTQNQITTTIFWIVRRAQQSIQFAGSVFINKYIYKKWKTFFCLVFIF